MRNSSKSFITRQDKSASLLNSSIANDQKHVSTKDFIESCPYRTENVDRNDIIK